MVKAVSCHGAPRSPSSVGGSIGGSRSGKYSPPSGARPASSASLRSAGGAVPPVLMNLSVCPAS